MLFNAAAQFRTIKICSLTHDLFDGLVGFLLVHVSGIHEHLLVVVDVLADNEVVDDVVDDLGVVDADWSHGIGQFNQSQVLEGSVDDLLVDMKSDLDEFLLADLQDGELLAVLSTGQHTGDQGTLQ